ncbi:hypothetical protein D9M68_915290 [compost metagenome]
MQQDGDARRQRRCALVVQGQGLAGLDLAARVAHHLAVDADQPLGDQPLGLAARADAGLAQPLVDADGFGAVIGAGEGHGLTESPMRPAV